MFFVLSTIAFGSEDSNCHAERQGRLDALEKLRPHIYAYSSNSHKNAIIFSSTRFWDPELDNDQFRIAIDEEYWPEALKDDTVMLITSNSSSIIDSGTIQHTCYAGKIQCGQAIPETCMVFFNGDEPRCDYFVRAICDEENVYK